MEETKCEVSCDSSVKKAPTL